jgi:hypothetical protein
MGTMTLLDFGKAGGVVPLLADRSTGIGIGNAMTLDVPLGKVVKKSLFSTD